jgi:hypothetical protein
MFSYLLWHYGDGLPEVSQNAVHRTIGFLNFFSVSLLAATLFAPWRRVIDPYGRGFSPQAFFWTLGMNLVSRLVGAVARVIMIVIGILATAGAAVAGAAFVLLWIASPVLVFVLPLFGFSLFA